MPGARGLGICGGIEVPTDANDQLRNLQPGNFEAMTDRERIKLSNAAASLLVSRLEAPWAMTARRTGSDRVRGEGTGDKHRDSINRGS
jgi:hypothetical protein